VIVNTHFGIVNTHFGDREQSAISSDSTRTRGLFEPGIGHRAELTSVAPLRSRSPK